MARLPPSGVAIATPYQDAPIPRVLAEADLRKVLIGLCPDAVFGVADVSEIYFDLQRLLGCWHAQQGRPDTASLAADLTKLADHLDSVVASLGSIEDGLHEIQDIEVVTKLVNVLLESEATWESHREPQAFVSSFRSDAIKVLNACRRGAVDFKQYTGKSGRPKLDWYDDFKTLLIRVARLGGIEPTLGKDRISSERTGWLVEAAQALESFLDPAMRSPDAESCGKRLERARVIEK